MLAKIFEKRYYDKIAPTELGQNTKYLLKLFFLVKLIKSNILNIMGLPNENKKTCVQIDFFWKILRLSLLKPFS